MNSFRTIFSTTLFVVGILGCSGSESGGSGGSTQLANVVTNLNGDLSGDIWTTKYGEKYNIETGVTIDLSDTEVYPSRDGSEYAELYFKHREVEPIGCNGDIDQADLVNIRDTKTGELKTSFEYVGTISGPIRFSPDGKYIGTFSTDPLNCQSRTTRSFTVFNRSGDVLIRANQDLTHFDWLPDNRVVFILDKDNGNYELAVETEALTLRYRVASRLEEVEGEPLYIKASPDGKRLLFEGQTSQNPFLSGVKYSNASIYSVNIDGSELLQHFATSRDGESRINEPVWSPDGKNILVTENYRDGVNTTFYGYDEITTVITGVSTIPVTSNSVSYAISAEEGRTLLPPESYSDTVRPIFTIQDGVVGAIVLNPLTFLHWTPSQ